MSVVEFIGTEGLISLLYTYFHVPPPKLWSKMRVAELSEEMTAEESGIELSERAAGAGSGAALSEEMTGGGDGGIMWRFSAWP